MTDDGQELSATGIPQAPESDVDELYDKAVFVVTESRKASISYVQRRLRVGYNRAATIVEQLEENGSPTRVVSVPCFELFENQSADYQQSIIGNSPVKVAVEAAIKQGWERFIGSDGIFVGMNSFGASAPGGQLFEHFGITADAVVEAATAQLENVVEEEDA